MELLLVINLREFVTIAHDSYVGTRFKRRIEGSRLDPEGFAAKANRRNNAETGNHAFKAILGDQIYSKNPIAQRNEILCMAIAYNLTRLVFLGLKEGVAVDFSGGVPVLSGSWISLATLRAAVGVRA